MLRLLLQLALISGGVALGASHMDGSMMQRVRALLREVGIGNQTASQTNPAAGDQPQKTSQKGEQTDRGLSEPLPRAFYGTPPEGCAWEKIIDPSDGSVRCALSERHSRQSGR